LRDMSAWALGAFGKKPAASSPAESYQELMAYLITEYGEGRQCILIVDESQNLSVDALEELRLLSNINSGKDLLLQIVLVGQPELLTKLKQPELCQFAQRIAVSHHLAPLPYVDTRRYIEHRLKIAGTEREIFTEMAMGAVQYFSGGVPRLINSICDLSLVYAFADGVTVINEDLVFRVVADRQVSGIAPFARTEAADNPIVRDEIRGMAEAAGVLAETRAPQPSLAPAALEIAPPTPTGAARIGELVAPPAARDLLFEGPEKDSLFDVVVQPVPANAGTYVATSESRHISSNPAQESETNSEARFSEQPAIRPSWSTPASRINSERWPSISDEQAGHKSDAENRIRSTAAPRSWWRRSFLRQS
jgi:hypothetical protein